MSTQIIEPAPSYNKQTPDLQAFAINEYKMGRTDETVKGRIQTLKRIAQTADLNRPEQVLLSLVRLPWKNSTKTTFLDTYQAYLKFKKIQWERPKYENEEKLPFIPTEQD